MPAVNPGPSASQTTNTQSQSAYPVNAAPVQFPMQWSDATGVNSISPTGVLSPIGNPSPYLTKWRNALAKVRSGTGRGRIMFIGDSTTCGGGAGTGGTSNLNGAWPRSMPNRVASILAARGVPTSSNSIVGDNNIVGVAYTTYDTRVTFGAGWSGGGGTQVGGALIKSTSTNTFSFLPTSQIDSFEVYYVKNLNTATITVNVNGGATLQTLDSTGGPSVLRVNQSVAKASNTINCVCTIPTFNLCGIVAYDSTTPAVDILQAGFFGSFASSWASNANPWSPSNINGLISLYAPDLVIIDLTINDSIQNINPASYAASMSTLIATVQAAGADIILVSGNPPQTASTPGLALILAQVQALATANNLTYMDVNGRFVSWTQANALGWMFDGLHPNNVGYCDIAQFIANNLINV